ncbi:MAG TPA: hypothetical protein PLZ45_10920, partial [Ferruginibacter sp.]|nr:hypothetical protein [Ferruginibacter sp.]
MALLFQIFSTNFSYGFSGPYFQDYTGQFWARAAGQDGSATNIVLRWFYPLQPGFYYPDTNKHVGDCVAWLDRRPGGTVNVPVDVNYDITWGHPPILQVGETLLNEKRGLPNIRSLASVQIAYDELQAQGAGNLLSLARLYDPLSTRTLKSVSVPSSIKRQN